MNEARHDLSALVVILAVWGTWIGLRTDASAVTVASVAAAALSLALIAAQGRRRTRRKVARRAACRAVHPSQRPAAHRPHDPEHAAR